jgi:hypothetical protein
MSASGIPSSTIAFRTRSASNFRTKVPFLFQLSMSSC